MTNRSIHRLEFVFIGVASVIAQTVFLRRLIGLFGGSEVQYALVLTIWLLEAGLWSLLAQRLMKLSDQVRHAALSVVYLSLCLLYPCYLILPFLKSVLFSPFGGAPISHSALFSIFALAIPTIYAGASFALLFGGFGRHHDEIGVSRGYLLDTVGFALGGLAITGILSVAGADPELLILLGVTGLWLCLRAVQKTHTRWLVLFPMSIVAIMLAYVGKIALPNSTDRERGSGSRFIVDATVSDGSWSLRSLSPYGQIDVNSDSLSTDAYVNSRLASSYPGVDAGESIVLPLAMVPSPRNLAILGGSLDGKAGFALQDTSLEVCQVEPDPVIRSLFVHMSGEGCLTRPKVDDWSRSGSDSLPWRGRETRHPAQFDSDRLSIVAKDPVDFLTGAQANLDVIFINYLDPATIAQGNYFTREFFELAKEKLSEKGVLAFSTRCGENFIPPERLDYIKSLVVTLTSVFPKVAIIPGETAMLIGGMPGSSVTTDADNILMGARVYGGRLAHYGSAYIEDILSQWRIEKLNGQLATHPGALLTTDTPQGFLLNSMFEMDKFRGVDSRILRSLRHLPRWSAVLLCLLPIALFSLAAVRSGVAASHLPVFYAGWFGLSANILLMAAYQSVAGSLFSRLGLLTGCFMIGLALGAALGQGSASRRLDRFGLSVVIFVSAACMLFLGLLLPRGLGELGTRHALQVTILVASAITGVFPGLIFSMSAGRHAPVSRRQPSAGSLYGMDLVGSAAGGLAATLILLPIIGVSKSILVISISGAFAGTAITTVSVRHKQP
jgi:predicted membrane-bound spermidine synthase